MGPHLATHSRAPNNRQIGVDGAKQRDPSADDCVEASRCDTPCSNRLDTLYGHNTLRSHRRYEDEHYHYEGRSHNIL
jgi:hypothetical protein